MIQMTLGRLCGRKGAYGQGEKELEKAWSKDRQFDEYTKEEGVGMKSGKGGVVDGWGWCEIFEKLNHEICVEFRICSGGQVAFRVPELELS